VADAYVGLGSNIDAERHLADAVEALKDRVGAVALSSMYRNPAVGFDGDDFLNLVLRLHSEAGPCALKEILSGIEQRAGRARAALGPGPRTLDLDLLLYGSLIEAPLRLPHAGVLKYSFVLCPLAELAPSLVHPVTGITVAESWQEMALTNPPLTNLGPLQATTPAGRQRLGLAEEG
jgi:2-amino-4-hydroxy-6-hydroxymethyldihydropteridine diphosphokinase